ncbi:hypothetical protein ES703_02604 [subsurface metagenome]
MVLTTVYGRCTGGFPAPKMLLEIYSNDVLVASRTIQSSNLVIGTTYDLSWSTITVGVYTVYGRMMLTNPLGSYDLLTETKSFEITAVTWADHDDVSHLNYNDHDDTSHLDYSDHDDTSFQDWDDHDDRSYTDYDDHTDWSDHDNRSFDNFSDYIDIDHSNWHNHDDWNDSYPWI